MKTRRTEQAITRKEGKTMKIKVKKQLEEVLKGVTTGEERALRIGATVKINRCPHLPEVVGEQAEIVDMQIQEFDEYATYPVWVKMITGERKGKIYGFHYDEIEVPPETGGEGTDKIKAVEQLEEMLKTMRLGGTVKIKKCDSLPEVVGVEAEIVDMQIQEFDRHATYPLWVKITSGERKGKVYGFHYDEVEVLPRVQAVKIPKSNLAEQLEEILKGINTLDELSEIEKAINEVKGKVIAEPAPGFWEGKTPCWETLRCPEAIRNECPAFKHQDLPCWQIEGTYTKLHEGGQKGDNTDICRVCRVYMRWGNNEPIEIKLSGKGFNHPLRVEEKIT